MCNILYFTSPLSLGQRGFKKLQPNLSNTDKCVKGRLGKKKIELFNLLTSILQMIYNHTLFKDTQLKKLQFNRASCQADASPPPHLLKPACSLCPPVELSVVQSVIQRNIMVKQRIIRIHPKLIHCSPLLF